MIDFGKFRIECCNGVYCPSDDSFLLGDIVEEYSFGKVLDLGTGSGYLGIIAALKGDDVTFADIDTNALECARQNVALNHLEGKFVGTDLFSGIEGKFNTIIFNPPYLLSDKLVDKALDGGFDGRQVIDKFLSSVGNHLLTENQVLLLESSLNSYEKDAKELSAEVFEKNLFYEKLAVLKFSL